MNYENYILCANQLASTAIREEIRKVLVVILGNNPNCINTLRNDQGQTMLHYALELKNHETIEFLLKQPNLDVEIKDNKGVTVRALAKSNGYISSSTLSTSTAFTFLDLPISKRKKK